MMTEPVYRHRSGVVVLLVNAQRQVALQLRDDQPGLPGANQWGIFGGLSDTQEPPEATALREIHEELSIHLDPERLTFYRQHYIPDQNLTTWVFLYPVTHELDQAVLREGQGWDFIGPTDPRAAAIGLHHREIVFQFWESAL